MVCKRCGTQNNPNATVCRQCGAPLRRPVSAPQRPVGSRPSSGENERKYIIVGSLTIIAMLVLLICGIVLANKACNNCGACAGKTGEEYVTESVGGEYLVDETAGTGEESVEPVEGEPVEGEPVEGEPVEGAENPEG